MKAISLAIGLLAVVGLASAGWVGWAIFAPVSDTTLDETLGANATVIRSGPCVDGNPLHHCEGNVSIVEDNGSHSLYFEDYDATNGPDVYFYLTHTANARTTQAVEDDGMIVLVPEGRKGQATVRGTFLVPIPGTIEPSAWNGLTVWCDDFDEVFGTVEFT